MKITFASLSSPYRNYKHSIFGTHSLDNMNEKEQ